MYNVAAYITAYEDPEAVNSCIAAIKKQSYPVKKIFIVDNSSKYPLDITQYEDSNIIVEFYPDNIGVAGGLDLGIRWAIGEDYDFLWTFDQDSIPKFDALEKLLINYEKRSQEGYTIGIIAPLPVDVNSQIEIHGGFFNKYKFTPAAKFEDDKGFYECDIVITSGSLVALAVAKEVEIPNKNLFIDAVDWVYCMNFKTKGYSVILVNNAIMKHNFGNYIKVKSILKRNKILFNSYSPLRYYYIYRNHTFVETRLSQGIYTIISVIYRIKVLIKNVLRILFYEPDFALLKAWAAILGTFDGLCGKLGKTW